MSCLLYTSTSGGYEVRNAYYKGCLNNKDISLISSDSAADKSRQDGTTERPLFNSNTVNGYSPFIAPYTVRSSSMERPQDSVRSVSYTHLDVYKRQVFFPVIFERG